MISPSPGFVRAILGFNYYYFLSPSSAFEQCRARRGCGSHHCVGAAVHTIVWGRAARGKGRSLSARLPELPAGECLTHSGLQHP